MRTFLSIIFIALFAASPVIAHGAELLTETHSRYKAEVVSINQEITKDISGTGVEATVQYIEARIISKEHDGAAQNSHVGCGQLSTKYGL